MKRIYIEKVRYEKKEENIARKEFLTKKINPKQLINL